MQLYFGCHSGTQSAVYDLTKVQQPESEFKPNLLSVEEHLLKLQDSGLRKVKNG